jgi:thiopeptide-type bacteriocin biosynthesis protein
VVAAISPLTFGPVGVLRVSTDPGGLELPEDLDLSESCTREAVLAWLAERWQRPEIPHAVAAASPALCAQIDVMLAEGCADDRHVRRVGLALASYLLRWQRRCTPFGLFAGVAPAAIGATAKIRCGSHHQVSVRADAAWLTAIIARLHQCPALLDRLPVMASTAAVRRGRRLFAPGAAPDAQPGEFGPLEASVRASRPVLTALDESAAPIAYAALRRVLADRFPTASTEQIASVCAGLLDEGFLITALRIPVSEPDALSQVCQVLRSVDATAVPQVADLVRELFALKEALAARFFDRVPAGLSERMSALYASTRAPLLIDTAADAEVSLPEVVAREARDAALVLLRLSPSPAGAEAWRDYHTAFRARYGTGALVPVLDLVSDAGLGYPAGYLGSVREIAPRAVSERDEKMLALVQQAMTAGGAIVLTDALIDELYMGKPAEPMLLPPRIEISVQVRAACLEDLSAGRFRLEVTGTPAPGHSMTGRHAHLLPTEQLAAIRASFTATEPEAVHLSFPPRTRRSENVARTSALCPRIIAIGEHRSTAADDRTLISLRDVAVSADDRGFHLIQISSGARIRGQVASALAADTHTPPLARFLSEVATGCAALYRSFSFGAASRMPYLPAVHYRRTILSPARWLLNAADLPGRRASLTEWERGLSTFRQRWSIPDHVAIVDHDRRQTVDLRHRLHRTLLRDRLERTPHLSLAECATPADLGWIGRAHELVLPLLTNPDLVQHQADGSRTPPSSTRRQPVTDDDLNFPAASTLVAARVHAHPARFEEILTDHLPMLSEQTADVVTSWWFHRHRDLRDHSAGQHLALFWRLREPDAFGQLAGHISRWGSGLHRAGLASHLSFNTWQSPAGRYGHGRALHAALDVFAADSAAAVAQIRAAAVNRVNPQALAALGFLDVAAGLAGDRHTGMSWLLDELPQHHGPLDRTLRDQTLRLGDMPSPLTGTSAGQAVSAAWVARADALATYRQALAEQREPVSVLAALLHIHHSRAVGVDPDMEKVTGRLARALVLRARATAERTAR